MKEKLTPQEKKRLSYDKDHRTQTFDGDRGMACAWAKRKKRVNRKYRRAVDAVLHKAMSPERIDVLKEGDDETTREMIRKGLSREKNHKWGVSSLKKALERLADSKKRSIEWKTKHRAIVIQRFRESVTAFEKNPEVFRDDEISWLAYQTRSSELRAFLKANPSWITRLQRQIDKVRKQKRIAAERARIRAEEKSKWNSPVPRLPRNVKTEEKGQQ
ncbi:MAG TPA: hypothetical protein VKT53_13100 [Candidatus Acidoferrum sp.]|nr:hypothetical protein [Candidatus Acidoferrum sp.]